MNDKQLHDLWIKNKNGNLSPIKSTKKSPFYFFNLLFKWLLFIFIIMLCFNVFRYFLGSGFLTFSDFLNSLGNCPDYFSETMAFLNDKISFIGGDSSNLPIIGVLIDFLSPVLGILVYFFGACYSALRYFYYVVTILF